MALTFRACRYLYLREDAYINDERRWHHNDAQMNISLTCASIGYRGALPQRLEASIISATEINA